MKTKRTIGIVFFLALLSAIMPAKVEAKKRVKMTAYRGETFCLTVQKNGKSVRTGKRYSYRVSNKKVVKVSKCGKVRAKSAGEAQITIQHRASRKKCKYKIRVVDYVKGISVNVGSNIFMREGETRVLCPSVYPKTAANRGIIYRSSDESILSVNQKGEIKAQKKGSAVITIQSKGTTKEKKKITKKIFIYVEESLPEKETTIHKPYLPDKDGAVLEGSVIISDTSKGDGEKGDTSQGDVTDGEENKGEAAEVETSNSDTIGDNTSGSGTTGGSQNDSKGDMADGSQNDSKGDTTDGSTSNEEQGESTTDSGEEGKKETLSDVIAQIPTPDSATVVAAKMAVKSANGSISTLYFLNRTYNGSVCVRVEDLNLSAAGSAASLLKKLSDTVTGAGVSVSVNPGNKQENKYLDPTLGVWRDAIMVTRPTKEDAWLFTNRKSGREYRLMVYENDPVYGTPYGLIVVEGNTLSDIEIKK